VQDSQLHSKECRCMTVIGLSLPLVNKESWCQKALCAEVGPWDLWFPEKGGSTKDAKRVCAGCPVKVECLDYALRTDQRFGIWGGFSEQERRRLKRKPPERTHCWRGHELAV